MLQLQASPPVGAAAREEERKPADAPAYASRTMPPSARRSTWTQRRSGTARRAASPQAQRLKEAIEGGPTVPRQRAVPNASAPHPQTAPMRRTIRRGPYPIRLPRRLRARGPPESCLMSAAGNSMEAREHTLHPLGRIGAASGAARGVWGRAAPHRALYPQPHPRRTKPSRTAPAARTPRYSQLWMMSTASPLRWRGCGALERMVLPNLLTKTNQ